MDGDAARACLARLREPDRQHAVPKLGLRLALRRPGETHHAPELPLASLPAVIGRVLRGLGERPLASQDQGVVLHRELEVLGPDARQLGLDHVVLPRVEQVDGRVERRRALGTERPLEHALELALQLRERVTIADRHGPPPVTTDAKGKPGSVPVNPAARLPPGQPARAGAATPRPVPPTGPGSRACRSPGRARRGVHGLERDDDGLARDAEPIEDLEDALDLLERDGRERHAVHPSAAAGSTVAGAGPRPTRSHARLASQTITTTRLMKRPHTTASSRRLKICTCTSASFAAGTLPAATPAASFSAWARKPIAGSGDKIFW